MRPILPFTALVLLAGAPLVPAPAAETAAAAKAVPAANAAFLAKAAGLVDKSLSQAKSALEMAKQAADLPMAGKSAKAKVTSAEAQVATVTQLKGELASLAKGEKPAADGILAKIAASAGTPAAGGASVSLGERLKGLPLASAVQGAFGNPELVRALVSNLPVDKVPGFAAAQQALSSLTGK